MNEEEALAQDFHVALDEINRCLKRMVELHMHVNLKYRGIIYTENSWTPMANNFSLSLDQVENLDAEIFGARPKYPRKESNGEAAK